MRTHLSAVRLLLLLQLCVASTTVWAQDRGFPPESRLNSRQGYPGQEDVIAHKSVSKNTHLLCLQVEHHPKQTEDGAACFLRFQNGDKHTLKFGETMQANSDGEVYLECLGDRPTKCTVGLY